MKIAFLSFYSGSVARGVETFVHELANRLVSFGHDVTVFQGGAIIPDSKYKCVIINASRVKEFTQIVLKEINSDTDIIFPTNGKWQSLLCSIWAKKNRKKIIISGQSGLGFDDRLNLLTFPNRFITLTNYQREWAKYANPFVKTEIIPNGVDLDKFTFKGPTFKVSLPGPIILCVAAFDDWKRIDLSIKAVSKLKSASLVLVGKGAEEVNLRRLGEELLPGRFKIMSFDHKNMPAIYNSADMFTFPTVPWESFGIVLVEAMASGLPVVATNDPIRKEIVGDAGILVDPTNIEEYAKALQIALDTNWGDKPINQAKKFNWDIIADQYDKLFKEII